MVDKPTMVRISYTGKQFTDSATEASDLGWPVGFVPNLFTVDGEVYHLKKAVRDNEGDVMWWRYASGAKEVKVFND